MNALILIISIVAPLVPVVMFPTRFFGRGLNGTILGAVLLVGAMMLIYVVMSATMGGSDDSGTPGNKDKPDPDMAALEQLLGN